MIRSAIATLKCMTANYFMEEVSQDFKKLENLKNITFLVLKYIYVAVLYLVIHLKLKEISIPKFGID